MIGNDGRPYKVTTVSDVTNRRETRRQLEDALRQKEILLREVHHRVKNNLNTLSSLISLQQNQVGSETETGAALAVVMNRIRAISSVYERLHQASDASYIDVEEYSAGLVQDIVNGTGRCGTLHTEVELVQARTDLDKGVTLGLVVNELVTNSIKHGNPGGTLVVKDPSSAHFRVTIPVSDGA